LPKALSYFFAVGLDIALMALRMRSHTAQRI